MSKKLIITGISGCIIMSNVLSASANIPFYASVQKQEVMALARENLSSQNSYLGQQISFKLVDDIKLNNQIIIPKSSIAVGEIVSIKKARRMSRHGIIEYKINKINTPSGSVIDVNNQDIKGHIVPQEYKDMAEMATEKAPVSAASYITTFAVDAAADLSGFLLYPIGVGVSAVAGFVTGYFDPDKGLTKIETAKRRAYYNTPIGYGHYMVAKGNTALINTGQSIMISISESSLEAIKKQNTSSQ